MIFCMDNIPINKSSFSMSVHFKILSGASFICQCMPPRITFLIYKVMQFSAQNILM